MQPGRILFLCLFASIFGCRVNPRADYDRAGIMIDRATGQTAHYQPDDDDQIKSRTDTLLKEGLTLEKAVQVALLNNRNLQAAWMQIGMARADYVQSGLLSNPTLDMSLRFPAAGGLPDLDWNLAQNIADLWQIPPRKRAAEHALTQAVLDLARQANDVASATKTAYYQAVGAQQAVDIAVQNVETTDQSLNLTLVRLKAGAGTEIDVNLSSGPALDAQLALTSAQLEKSEARRELAKLLGLAQDAETLPLLDPLPDPPSTHLDPEALVQLAHQERLDLRSAAQAVDASAARLQQQWRLIFPNVQLGVASERNAQKHQEGRHVAADTVRSTVAAGALTAPPIQSQYERHRNSSIAHNDIITGPSMNITIPAFDQNQAQIAKAVFVYRQAVKSYEAADLTLTQDVRTAVARAITASDIALFYREKSIPLAQSNLKLAIDTYRAGQSSLLQVLELQRFVLDTRSKYVQALRDAATKLADLERAVGLPLKDILAAITPAEATPTTNPANDDKK